MCALVHCNRFLAPLDAVALLPLDPCCPPIATGRSTCCTYLEIGEWAFDTYLEDFLNVSEIGGAWFLRHGLILCHFGGMDELKVRVAYRA